MEYHPIATQRCPQVGFTESNEIRDKKTKNSARIVLDIFIKFSHMFASSCINHAMMTASIHRSSAACFRPSCETVDWWCGPEVMC